MAEKTLELIEWPRLCQHLSTFASTRLGAIAAEQLVLPQEMSQSQYLLQQTQEVIALEIEHLTPLKFAGVADIGVAIERASRQGTLSGQELWDIGTTLSGARNLRRVIEKYPELTGLKALVANMRTYPELEQQICHCIDEQGEVMERASEKLGGLRAQRLQTYRLLQDTLQKMLHQKASSLQEAVITQRSDRFVLPVKAPRKDQVPGIVHDISTSGATLYIEPRRTVEMNNKLRQLTRKEDIECEAIRRELSEKVAAIQEDLEQVLHIVTTLDLAVARAQYSLWIGGFCPTWNDESSEEGPSTSGPSMVLRQLRHPLLVWQEKQGEGESVVPTDLVIRSDIKVVAITGPNTGGKTVTLKTLALAISMAKAGIFVPAKGPIELPWFDHVFADIGDEQSIEQSLSTFSGHVRRIQAILTQVTPKSLVLLDEVGAGTDPTEGSALAIALLKHLADHAKLTVATTHYGELKTLKYQDSRFENASVEFDDQSLAPTYRLLWGIPGRSNALIIAERLGFSREIIEQAQHVMEDGAEDFNEVITHLEKERRTQESKAQAAASLLANTENLHQELQQKAQELRAREQKIKQQQEQELQRELDSAKQNIARVIRTLQRGPQDAKAAHKATENLNAIAQTLQPKKVQPKKVKGFKPKEGDRVRLMTLGQTAEVISPVSDSGDLMVRFGMMKMTVNLRDIESLTGEKAEPIKKTRAPKAEPLPPAEVPMIRTSQNTLDLRGHRVAEAEQMMDDKLASAFGPIWIIHGHGTGKLRRGVQEYLKRHSRVSKFEFAEQSDGGKGVTIAHCA